MPSDPSAATVVTWRRKRRDILSGLFSSRRSASNVAWNLLGGVSTGVLVVLVTPFYVARLGLEGYGIVGLWLVLQVMMGLLDVGMSATVIKAFASASPDREGNEFKRDLLRTLEVLYWGVAAAFCVVLVLAAQWTGSHWIRATTLPIVSVRHAMQWMALALALQFPAALYSSGLAGLQEQGKMNALQIVGSTLRYGAGVLVLLWRADVYWFFAAQALVAAIQTLATRQVLRRLIFKLVAPHALVRFALIQRMWRYSAGMALSSLGAVLMGNADRLAVSVTQSGAELGKYSVAFTATGLIQLGIQPFYRAFFPRYAELIATGDASRLRVEYFRSCQLVAVLIIPLGVIGWIFAPQLLSSWLGRSDPTITNVFRWLLVGISCAGLMWLPAAFQQAHGWTGLHARMIIGALVIGAPLMLGAIRAFGTVGATTVWVLHGLSGLTIELWLMHRRLLVGQLAEWYRVVILPPLALTLPLTGLSFWAMPAGLGRWTSLEWVIATGVVVVGCGLAFTVARSRAGVQPIHSEAGAD